MEYYWQKRGINKALKRIHDGTSTMEHRTSTATDSLVHHYFTSDNFLITPEQTQVLSRKKPDYTIERLDSNDNCHFHAFVEVKSLVKSNFDDILDQLAEAITMTVDSQGGAFAAFAIAMKGSQIAFYLFCSFVSELDQYNIYNCNGFIPLNYPIPFEQFQNFNLEQSNLIDYLKQVNTSTAPAKPEVLKALGVEYTKRLDYPHIWDANNEKHRKYVHELFEYARSNLPGSNLKD